MNTFPTRPLGFSLTLHAAALGALILAFAATPSLPSARISRSGPFILVPVLPGTVSSQVDETPASVSFRLPIATHRTEPTTASAAGPAAAHVALESDRPAAAPTPRPIPAKITSGRPRQPDASPATSHSTALPQIDTHYRGVLTTPPAQSTPMADALPPHGFSNDLLADLQSAFVRTAGSVAGLSAVVEFTLAADGALVDAQILQSSGVDVFDTAVLAAFARVRAKGFTPPTVGLRYRVTFRTTDNQ